MISGGGYITEPPPGCAEVAFTTDEDYQGGGLARPHLVRIARENVSRFEANQAMFAYGTNVEWLEPSVPVRCFYGADFVKGVPQGSYPFSHPSVSLFDLAAVSSPRPTHRVAGARRSGQGCAVHRAATDRLGLDGSEHDGILVVVGMTTSEGSSHVVHEHSRHILLFGGGRPRP
jgi:hypothetical protein